MTDSSRAVLRSALETAKALLAPARGRHSARRRRSTRVRPYAPTPAPITPEPTPDPPQVSVPPAPRPTPPVRDAAFIRPYLLAHERELAYADAHPARRLRARTTQPTADGPRVVNPAYTPKHAAPVPAPPRVPAPRPAPEGDLLAAPPTREPGEFDELASLVRTWHAQRSGLRPLVPAD
ncbi:hypothetical protein KIK06_17895 [Nocardiopsis sp. EMB25]|uniref:hypothetical protein n=1 Tax=Nocardiopsis sp. EMB25 TaxID=2835867 RepID=UPI00228455B9|nr:hypothetical protein [Nocardiopsis sp. EMB25]MCY9785763.1 hypothetical protein [Nocardiopsis sp. EMB25]